MFNALIRTHHITSRKKVAILKSAAKKLNCYALLRSGGIPGIMYVEAKDMDTAQKWVNIVHGLRYKDYHLAATVNEAKIPEHSQGTPSTLDEVETVKEFAALMDRKELTPWWRVAMGFANEDIS